jgi:hypothetical protein
MLDSEKPGTPGREDVGALADSPVGSALRLSVSDAQLSLDD